MDDHDGGDIDDHRDNNAAWGDRDTSRHCDTPPEVDFQCHVEPAGDKIQPKIDPN